MQEEIDVLLKENKVYEKIWKIFFYFLLVLLIVFCLSFYNLNILLINSESFKPISSISGFIILSEIIFMFFDHKFDKNRKENLIKSFLFLLFLLICYSNFYLLLNTDTRSSPEGMILFFFLELIIIAPILLFIVSFILSLLIKKGVGKIFGFLMGCVLAIAIFIVPEALHVDNIWNSFFYNKFINNIYLNNRIGDCDKLELYKNKYLSNWSHDGVISGKPEKCVWDFTARKIKDGKDLELSDCFAIKGTLAINGCFNELPENILFSRGAEVCLYAGEGWQERPIGGVAGGDEGGKILCYKQAAIYLGDESLCNKINNSYDQEDCKKMAGSSISKSVWQTYTNQKYNFSMQLPNNWTQVQNNQPTDYIEFKITSDKNNWLSDFAIYKLDNPNKKPLQQIFDDEYNTCEQNPTPMGCPGATNTRNWQKITVLGKSALLSNEAVGIAEGPATNYFLYVDFGNYFLVFRGTDWSKIDNFQNVFNQIINTIKF